MTRKDYELIANTLKEVITHWEGSTNPVDDYNRITPLYDVMYAFANTLQLENNRFDRTKFIGACRSPRGG